VTAWRWQTVAGLQEETYVYEGERLTTIRTSGPNDPPHVFRCEWGPTGLVRITGEREGSGRVVEVFRSAPSTSPNAIALLEDLLFRAIVEQVRALDVQSPAYALLLVESAGYDAAPPELAIGLESEREAWSAEPRHHRERVWSPEDLSLFHRPYAHLDEAGVQSAARAVRDALREDEDPEGAHRLNVRVAKRLNDESHLLVLPRTDDFVVVVVGLEEGLQRAELDAYVPVATLDALRAAGWL
jgi:hypothetical protein